MRTSVFLLVSLLAAASGRSSFAQFNVSVHVDAFDPLRTVPGSPLGLHTSVYSNQAFAGATLASRLDEAGVNMLRYPGGSYSDLFHWSVPPQLPYYRNGGGTNPPLPDVSKPHPLTPDQGKNPTVNNPWPYGYYASGATFPSFVRLLDNSASSAMITVNYGSSLGNLDASNVWRTTKGGQPKEAAAWVAYANADPNIYGTTNDIAIGLDEEGIDWRTAGYWAKLRATSDANAYRAWSQAASVYNPANEFLAINHPQPVGIKYWEIGNEINGNGYYGTPGWETDYHAPYGVNRANRTALSPTNYANNVIAFANAMKAVDPTIKIGAVLVGNAPGAVGDTASATTNWDRNVLQTAGNQIDFGILHWYPNNGTDPATRDSNLLAATASQLPSVFQELRHRVDLYTNRDPNTFEIHMTEFGYFGSVSSNVVSGLFDADTYATAISQGAASVHYLEMSAGFLSDDATLTPGSAFRAMQMVDHLLSPGDTIVGSASASSNLKAYAVRQPDGSLAMMLVNLASGSEANVSVNLSGFTPVETGSRWLWGNGQSDAPLQTTVTGLGSNFAITVPGQSMIVLQLAAIPGDFNSDGSVDAADYVVWRKGLGVTISQEQYAIWREGFGIATAHGAAALVIAVPEPIACSQLIFGLLLAYTYRASYLR